MTLLDLTSETETDLLDMIAPYEEDEDPRRKTHIVNPPMNMHIWQPGMSAQAIVNIARLQGKYVVTLCGQKFVPIHNPEKTDACDECIKIAGDLMRGAGE